MTSAELFWADDDYQTELITTALAYHKPSARSLQVEPGPSEISTLCTRKIALRVLGTPRTNAESCPWPTVMGIAGHAYLEEAFSHANTLLDHTRWHTEMPVTVCTEIHGTTDLYDADTHTIIDFKFPNARRWAQYREQMSEPYRRQIALYGLGVQRMGHPVDRVGILLVPRGGTLTHAHLWSEPFDRDFAESVLENYYRAITFVNDFDIEHHPERIAWIPGTDDECEFCAYYSPNPTTPHHCSGVLKPAALSRTRK